MASANCNTHSSRLRLPALQKENTKMVKLDPEYFGNAVYVPTETLADGVYFELWDGTLRVGKTEGLGREVLKSGRVELLEGLLTAYGESFVTLFVKNGKVLVQHFFYAPQSCWQVYFEPFTDDRRAMGIVPRRHAA